MANINVASIKAELDEYIDVNTNVLSVGLNASEVQLDKYCTTITKVKGKYPQFHKIMTHVVQGFKAEWQEMGAMQFNAKVLQNFRQKVNLPIVVDEIYGTWLSELKIEGKTPEEQPISKMMIASLLEQVIDDLSDLSITADTTAGVADGNFGYSFNGITKVLSLGLANLENPFYHIPLDAITTVNVLDMFKQFERTLPKKGRKKVERIFCSDDMALMYGDAIVEKYGDNTNYNDDRKGKTETYKFEIVGLEGLPDDVIFATHKGNMLKLVDLIDNPPTITDTQVQDYKLKIFMEFHLGYDFGINEVVYVADFNGLAQPGLNDDAKNALYYSSENLPLVV